MKTKKQKQNQFEGTWRELLFILGTIAIAVFFLIGMTYWAEQHGIELGKNQTLSNTTLWNQVYYIGYANASNSIQNYVMNETINNRSIIVRISNNNGKLICPYEDKQWCYKNDTFKEYELVPKRIE